MSNYVNNRNQSTKPAPKELIVRIEVPRVKSLADMQLDTDQRRLSFSVPDIYELTVDLPYAVDSSRGSAKFDKSTGRLTIVLPVVLSS
jgi:dynein assembly factor 2